MKPLGRLKVIFIVAAELLCCSLVLNAQSDPIQWSLKATPPVLRGVVGEKLTLTLHASIAEGWHLYSVEQEPGGPTPTRIAVPAEQVMELAGPIEEPAPRFEFDPNFGMTTQIFEETTWFKLPAKMVTRPTAKEQEIRVNVSYQVCNEQMCLPPKLVTATTILKFSGLEKAPAATTTSNQTSFPKKEAAGPDHSAPAVAAIAQPSSEVPAQPINASASVTGVRPTTTPPTAASPQSFRSFLWLAALMGAVSLLTPCVFPMIPITVSYFTNHGGGTRRSAVVTALIYTLGIVLTFTALGMLLAAVFGAAGVNQLAANPWVNLLITAIFLAFAFSLFGAYFLQVPPGLMNRIDSLTRSKEGSRVVGALLMGFTFTLTSFTCTAPFVGTLLVMTAQGNWRWPLAGMLAYSTIFAIPFFILALGPQLLSRLPKAGGWMNSVKIVMGFLEIAAAMKFLSNADLVWRWGIFTRQVVLAVWVAIGVMTCLYILGYFRMSHDSPVESVGVPRLASAMMFATLTIWLIPGLFGRQLGELESFLPPETTSSATTAASGVGSLAKIHTEADWILNDYDAALAKAKQENKLVFVDFTGYTCTNCRWMESNMFPRPEVSRELSNFVRVRLYTDGTGDIFERQQKMQQQKFGTVALPYYAILRPDGTPLSTFPGLTRDASAFTDFLRKGRSE